MRSNYSLGFVVLAIAVLIGCETEIYPKLEATDPILVVDAWLTNEVSDQQIKLTKTQPYFDNSAPKSVSGAAIRVTNESTGQIFPFFESEPGIYTWHPPGGYESLGSYGDVLKLSVDDANSNYISQTKIGRVPRIDSITFTFEEGNSFFPEQYLAEVYAKDLPGAGDCYWIKSWKNGQLLLKPSEINIAYDAGFSEGSSFDAVTFITPIRQGINPNETAENGDFLPAFTVGDSVFVQIYSISKAAFNFLTEVKTQTDRPGGFGELFSSPFSNVSTNIYNTDPNGKTAVGFFNVGSVSGQGNKLSE